MKIGSKVLIFLMAIIALQGCKVFQKAAITKSATTQQAILKAMQWQEANPIFTKAPTDWTNGAYYLGVVKAHESTKNREYLGALKSMIHDLIVLTELLKLQKSGQFPDEPVRIKFG